MARASRAASGVVLRTTASMLLSLSLHLLWHKSVQGAAVAQDPRHLQFRTKNEAGAVMAWRSSMAQANWGCAGRTEADVLCPEASNW